MIKLNVSKSMDDAVAKIVTAFEEPLEETEVEALANLFKIKLNLASGNLTEKEAAAGMNNIDRKNEWLHCVFTSEWSDGTDIVTDALYDPETDEVRPDVSDSMPGKDAKLEAEYIDIVLDGESQRFNVCPTCHEYIIRKGADIIYSCKGCGYEGY